MSKLTAKSKPSTILVEFNPPSLGTYGDFSSYRTVLNHSYQLGLEVGRSKEVIVGYLHETRSVQVMLGIKSFVQPNDGLEIYLYKPSTQTRFSLGSVHEIMTGVFQAVLQPQSELITAQYDYLPVVMNTLLFNPLFPQYRLEYYKELLPPFRLIVGGRDWVPLRITKGERVAINTHYQLWDSDITPLRIGPWVPTTAKRWNTNYVGSNLSKHERARVNPICDVTVTQAVASQEQHFNPDIDL